MGRRKKSSSVKEFDELQVFYDYLFSPEWESKNFGMSMLGKCKRQSIFKKAHVPKMVKTKIEKRKQDIKFDMADDCETKIIDAWFDRGVLVSSQLTVNQGLPPNWAGRLDAWLNRPDIGFEIVEIKASHPNMFTRSTIELPKYINYLQCLGYLYAVNNWFMGLKPFGDLDCNDFLVSNGRVIYMNRGGESEPLPFPFKFTKKERLIVIKEIKSVNKCWKAYNKTIKKPLKKRCLPDMLGKTVKIRKKKKKGADTWEAVLEPSWECDWCDYCDVSCHPDKAKNKCGHFDSEGEYIVRKNYDKYEKEAMEAKEQYDLLYA